MTVLIAGGGIGGLTLALSLHQMGVPCRIFESVAALKPLGVGREFDLGQAAHVSPVLQQAAEVPGRDRVRILAWRVHGQAI